MKKIAITLVLFSLVVGLASARDLTAANEKPFSIDAGLGPSFGLMQEGEGDGLDAMVTFFSTLRGGIYASGQYQFADHLSAGLRVGVYTITFSANDGDAVTLVDIPIQALIRYNVKFLTLEAFTGYYLSMMQSDDYNFAGFEAGGRIYLGPVYGSVSAVVAKPAYTRFEVGVNIAKLLQF